MHLTVACTKAASSDIVSCGVGSDAYNTADVFKMHQVPSTTLFSTSVTPVVQIPTSLQICRLEFATLSLWAPSKIMLQQPRYQNLHYVCVRS